MILRSIIWKIAKQFKCQDLETLKNYAKKKKRNLTRKVTLFFKPIYQKIKTDEKTIKREFEKIKRDKSKTIKHDLDQITILSKEGELLLQEIVKFESEVVSEIIRN